MLYTICMDEDTLSDLKQFVAATISQQISSVHDDVKDLHQDIVSIRNDIAQLDHKLSTKIDTLSTSVAEAMDNMDEATHEQLKDHEKRLTRLEHKAA